MKKLFFILLLFPLLALNCGKGVTMSDLAGVWEEQFDADKIYLDEESTIKIREDGTGMFNFRYAEFQLIDNQLIIHLLENNNGYEYYYSQTINTRIVSFYTFFKINMTLKIDDETYLFQKQ